MNFNDELVFHSRMQPPALARVNQTEDEFKLNENRISGDAWDTDTEILKDELLNLLARLLAGQ